MVELILFALGQVFRDLPWRDWLGMALHEAIAAIRDWVKDQWAGSAELVAAELQAQGATVGMTKGNRQSPAAYVSEIQYKLWKVVTKGGWVRNRLRDSHNAKVTAAVAGLLDPADHLHNVRAVALAEHSLTF